MLIYGHVCTQLGMKHYADTCVHTQAHRHPCPQSRVCWQSCTNTLSGPPSLHSIIWSSWRGAVLGGVGSLLSGCLTGRPVPHSDRPVFVILSPEPQHGCPCLIRLEGPTAPSPVCVAHGNPEFTLPGAPGQATALCPETWALEPRARTQPCKGWRCGSFLVAGSIGPAGEALLQAHGFDVLCGLQFTGRMAAWPLHGVVSVASAGPGRVGWGVFAPARLLRAFSPACAQDVSISQRPLLPRGDGAPCPSSRAFQPQPPEK